MRPSRLCRSTISLFILFIGLGLPAVSPASVKQGVKIRWFGERPQAAQAGREFVGRFEIITPKAGRLDRVELTGNGWALRGIDHPGAASMGRGDRRVVTFRAVPQDPEQPLTVRAIFDGVPVERTIRLDAASLNQRRRVSFRNQAGPKLSGQKPRLSPGTTERVMDTALNFSGTFQYQRGDGVWIGADNIIVKVWDDDSPDPFDEVIWSGMTDQNGHFSGSTIWDDCDLTGCDDPDIYLEIIPTGQVAELQQDDLLETTWSWETDVIDDFPGNDIDFGVMTPGSDPDGNAAVHIFNSMVKAHRFALNRHNMNAERVDVLWPDENDGTHYDHFWEEIHIARVRTWNELSQTHEFAHHLHNLFGNLLDNDYENGYCDDPDPGHCVWCPENVGDAWQEGFANWYGQVVTEDYPVSYNLTPWAAGTDASGNLNEGRYNMDGVGLCEQDNQSYPGSLTEGYVMAILRDMADPAAPFTDDHDGDGTFDCDTDAMDGGADEILTVFRENDPTDITMFLNSFRQRYLYYGQDLWSTARNVDVPAFGFPLPDPAVVTHPPSCRMARLGDTVTLQVAGNGSLLQYQWRLDGTNLIEGSGATGATDSILTLSPVDFWMGGTYDCVIRTCDGTKQTTTTPMRLTLLPGTPTARPYLTWGENGWAQCGNGTKVAELPPGSYTGLTNVVEADGGRLFSVALRADGTVWTWGHTDNGEIGNGGGWNNLVPSPTQINLANVVHIAAGQNFSLALLRDGSVRGWGVNSGGQQGDSTWMDHYVPSATKHSGCIIAIAAGHAHSLALRADGTVLASGFNGLGSLGIGTIGGSINMPTPVVGLSDVVAIAASGYDSYALKADGTVWSWGYNDFGQLGNGTNVTSGTPVQVTGLTNIRAITASYYNGYAITSTDEVYAWGRGDMGTIGDGTANWRFTPVLIPGLTNVKKIVAGEAGWAMALLQNGTAKAWGYNINGVLGTGAPNGGYRFTPETVVGVTMANNLGAGTATAHVMSYMTNVTGVESEPSEPAPLKLALRVAPVPSRSTTSLAFDLPHGGRVSINVYDVAGRLVRSVVSETRPAGRHAATWDGRSRSGSEAPAGVYFARLEREGEVLTRRIVLVR